MSSEQLTVHGFLLAERVSQSEAHNLGTHSAIATREGRPVRLWNNVRPPCIENVLSLIAPPDFPAALPAFGVFFCVSHPDSRYRFDWEVRLTCHDTGEDLGLVVRHTSASVSGVEPGRQVCVVFNQENPLTPGLVFGLGEPFTIPREGLYTAHLLIDGENRARFDIEARSGD